LTIPDALLAIREVDYSDHVLEEKAVKTIFIVRE
jgi:hypothetical protein